MAFSVETTTSQARPKSVSNINSHEQNQTISNNNNNHGPINHSDANNNQKECRKSQRYNIDDPGASPSAGDHLQRITGGERLWREKLLAQLQLLSEENNANSAYEGFAYVHNDNHTDCHQHAATSKNHTDQGARLQQQQPDRAQRASNSSYQNTLFTRVGTNQAASETYFAYDELFSKLYNSGASIPYRDVVLSDKPPNRERFDSRFGDANGPGFEYAPDFGVNGWYTADRCRYGVVPPGCEWSNAYCHS